MQRVLLLCLNHLAPSIGEHPMLASQKRKPSGGWLHPPQKKVFVWLKPPQSKPHSGLQTIQNRPKGYPQGGLFILRISGGRGWGSRSLEDGMKVQGYNGSMAWDTSFAMQAAVEADLVLEFKETLKRKTG